MENNITDEAEALAYREEVSNGIWGDGKEVEIPLSISEDEETPIKVETPVGELQPEKEEKPPEVNVDPAVQAMFDSIGEKIDGLSNNLSYRVEQSEKRIGSLQNTIRDTKPPEKPPEDYGKVESDKTWKNLEQEYPEWGDVFSGMDKRFADKDNASIEVVREKLQTDFNKKLTDVQQRFEVKLVDMKHPGWRGVVASPEYLSWLGGQEPDIQDKANNSNNAIDAISVLDLYAKPVDKPTEEINERLERAIIAKSSKSSKKVTALDDMTDADFRKSLIAGDVT